MAMILEPGRTFVDNSNRVLASGTVRFCEPGTGSITLKATYPTNADLLARTNANTNPMTLDSSGRMPLEAHGNGTYRIVVKNSLGQTLYDISDVSTSASTTANVIDYGATGDGSTDDATAVQDAVDAVEAAGGGIVRFPRGDYLLGSVITVTGNSVTFEGEGAYRYYTVIGNSDEGATNLIASHNAGSVVRVSGHDFSIRDMNITSNAARYAGASGALTSTVCAGLHIEGPDAAGGSGACNNHTIERVAIGFQPYHGLLCIGSVVSTHIESVACIGNLGHGFCFDRGTESARTNQTECGIVTIMNGRAHDNEGHGLCGGHPDDAGSLGCYRLKVTNFEAYRNAVSATVRHAAYGIWVNGQNNVIEQSAFGIYPAADTAVGGLCIGGRVNRVRDCRWVNHAQPVSVIEVTSGTTRDIEFTGMMFSLSTTPVAYAVLVAAGCENVRAHAAFDARGASTQYTALLQANYKGYEIIEADGIRSDYAAEHRGYASSPTFTIADDAVQSLEMQTLAGAAAATGGLLAFACQAQATVCGLVAYRVGTTPYITSLGVGSDVNTTTGILAGTTGTNGKTTISAHTDGFLYIENRMGGTITMRITILSNTSGQLQTYF